MDALLTKTLRFKVISPVFRTLVVGEVEAQYANKRFSTSSEVYEQFRYLADESKEQFIALHLDNKNRLLCIDIISVGSLTASIVHPREVFKSILLSSAAAVVFIHNHPSGDPEPSREDLDITTRLRQGGELLGIRVLDHIIIGDRHVSLADRGLL